MQSWVGHHKHELIVAWGPPHSERQDGAGGEVLIYQYQHSLNGKDYYWATRMFYVDTNRNGVILPLAMGGAVITGGGLSVFSACS